MDGDVAELLEAVRDGWRLAEARIVEALEPVVGIIAERGPLRTRARLSL
jgi:hypothetical protein